MKTTSGYLRASSRNTSASASPIGPTTASTPSTSTSRRASSTRTVCSLVFGAPPDQLDVPAGNPRLGDTSGRLPVRQAGAAPEQRQLGAGEHLVLVAGEDPATVGEQADPHRLLAAGAARCGHSERRDGQQTRDPREISAHRRSPTRRPRPPQPRVAGRLRRSRRRPRRVRGSMRDTVPSIVLVTHTEPAPAATPLVPRPVGIVARDRVRLRIDLQNAVVERRTDPDAPLARRDSSRDEGELDGREDAAAPAIEPPHPPVDPVAQHPHRPVAHGKVALVDTSRLNRDRFSVRDRRRCGRSEALRAQCSASCHRRTPSTRGHPLLRRRCSCRDPACSRALR